MRIRLFHRTIVVELTVAISCSLPHATLSLQTVSNEKFKLKLLYNRIKFQHFFSHLNGRFIVVSTDNLCDYMFHRNPGFE